MEHNDTILVSARPISEKSAEIHDYQKNHPEEDLHGIYWALDPDYREKMVKLAKEEPFKFYYENQLMNVLRPYKYGNDYEPSDRAIRQVLENHPQWNDCFREVDAYSFLKP